MHQRQRQFARLAVKRSIAPMRAALVACAISLGCTGAEPTAITETPAPEVPQPITPPPVPAPDTIGNGAVIAALLIDPANLPNYIAALPASYGPGVLQREDRAASDPITNAGATLGRVLFYERKLSRNETTSCASCHQQSLAFGDTARFSV